jgi:hypothetical protein
MIKKRIVKNYSIFSNDTNFLLRAAKKDYKKSIFKTKEIYRGQ